VTDQRGLFSVSKGDAYALHLRGLVQQPEASFFATIPKAFEGIGYRHQAAGDTCTIT
jgi:hypothetical protein